MHTFKAIIFLCKNEIDPSQLRELALSTTFCMQQQHLSYLLKLNSSYLIGEYGLALDGHILGQLFKSNIMSLHQETPGNKGRKGIGLRLHQEQR